MLTGIYETKYFINRLSPKKKKLTKRCPLLLFKQLVLSFFNTAIQVCHNRHGDEESASSKLQAISNDIRANFKVIKHNIIPDNLK